MSWLFILSQRSGKTTATRLVANQSVSINKRVGSRPSQPRHYVKKEINLHVEIVLVQT